VHYAQLVIDDVLLAHGLLLVKNKPLNDSPLHKITGGGLLGSGGIIWSDEWQDECHDMGAKPCY
jgi:hypothetical protein